MNNNSASQPLKSAKKPKTKSVHSEARKRFWRITLLIVLLCLIGGGLALALWLRPYAASTDAVAALRSTTSVSATQNDEIIAFLPHTPARVGLIFYPGAKIDPVAYAISMHTLAEHDYVTFIVKMPLDIALPGENRADDMIAAHPDITVWAVGGHSLGGVAACTYAAAHPKIKGLLLFASYPSDDIPQHTNLQIHSLSVSCDGLATLAKIAAAKHLLPPATTFTVIQGGIHGYFGDYGTQDGDGQPTISRVAALNQIIASSLVFLQHLAEEN